jgi:hypothetical protein
MTTTSTTTRGLFGLGMYPHTHQLKAVPVPADATLTFDSASPWEYRITTTAAPGRVWPAERSLMKAALAATGRAWGAGDVRMACMPGSAHVWMRLATDPGRPDEATDGYLTIKRAAVVAFIQAVDALHGTTPVYDVGPDIEQLRDTASAGAR